MIVRNRWRTRTVNVSEIRAITLPGLSIDQTGDEHFIPLVELTNGDSVWIRNFDCGKSAVPKSELAATVDELRAFLGGKRGWSRPA